LQPSAFISLHLLLRWRAFLLPVVSIFLFLLLHRRDLVPVGVHLSPFLASPANTLQLLAFVSFSLISSVSALIYPQSIRISSTPTPYRDSGWLKGKHWVCFSSLVTILGSSVLVSI
jgi:hypothetical protein